MGDKLTSKAVLLESYWNRGRLIVAVAVLSINRHGVAAGDIGGRQCSIEAEDTLAISCLVTRPLPVVVVLLTLLLLSDVL